MSKEHFSQYDEATTARCERALITLLGDVGPWRERIYLAGGLADFLLEAIDMDSKATESGKSELGV